MQNNFKEVYKKVCCTCKVVVVVVVVVVLLIRPIDVFGYFCCRRRLALLWDLGSIINEFTFS